MTVTPRDAARAFLAALRESPEERRAELARNFLAFLERRGLRSKAARVAEELAREAARAEGGRTVTIETARQLEPRALAALKARLRPKDEVRTAIRPELIAGMVLKVGEETVIDASLKRKLKKLFA